MIDRKTVWPPLRLALIFGWIALKLVLVTMALDHSVAQFIYAGF